MARVEIGYDREKRLFSIEVGVVLPDPMAPPSASLGNWQLVKMIVDSGSNTTARSEDDARRLGVHLERLEMKPTGGVPKINAPLLPHSTAPRLPGDG